ncbi:MAG: ATP-binding protein [Gammaproteobacteria bacterium]|nr:ATP-binding protein [Gammaproteobacteria bacterium]
MGIDTLPVQITARRAPGGPGVCISGLSDAAAREVKVRVECALRAVGLAVPSVDVGVAPEGGHAIFPDAAFDLPIALEVLRAAGTLTFADRVTAYGELSLHGRIRPVRGISCRLEGDCGTRAVIPADNAAEAAWFVKPGDEPVACGSLTDAVAWLHGERGCVVERRLVEPKEPAPVDAAVAKHEAFALLVNATITTGIGRALLVAPPGVGSTVLARSLVDMLPALTPEQACEVTRIYSVAGLTCPDGPITRRPFRAPHHTVSVLGLTGGGDRPRPGEVSLAHRGVLMLDDVTEFGERQLRCLVQDLNACESYPQHEIYGLARFPAYPAAVVATARPCQCGYYGSTRRACHCTPAALERYQQRLQRIQELLEATRVAMRDAPRLVSATA